MKVTTEIPDELYRQVEAKSAFEGRPVSEVVIEFFRSYVDVQRSEDTEPVTQIEGTAVPPWFGVLGGSARRVAQHGMEAIRNNIARSVGRERER